MKKSSYFSISVLALLWGGAFIFLELALLGLPPLTIVFLRVALASITLLGIAWWKGIRFPRERSVWCGYLCLGCLSNVFPFLLIAWAQQWVASGVSSTLCALTPVFTLVIGRLFLPEVRFSRYKISGIGLGLVAVSVLLVPGLATGSGGTIVGITAVLMAAFCYGCGAVVGKWFDHFPPIMNAAAMLGCSTVLLFPLILWNGLSPLAEARALHFVAVACLAELSTAGGFVLYFHILRKDGPIHASWISFLVPVSAALLGALFLRQYPQPTTMVACGFVLAGLWMLSRDARAADSASKTKKDV